MKPLVTIQMYLEGIMLSEITQTEKDKYYMISESKTNKTETDIEQISHCQVLGFSGKRGGCGYKRKSCGDGTHKYCGDYLKLHT